MRDWEIREATDEDQAAPLYHDLYHTAPIAQYWDDDFFDFAADLYSPGDRILDLGCGPGSLWSHWSRLEEPGALVGVDISEAMIAEARTRYPEGDFRLGRVHDLPFEAGAFDLVIASSVLHHVPDDELDGALKDISRVLDEHGRIVGREPNSRQAFGMRPGWLSGAIMGFRHLAFRLTRTREYPQPELGDHHHVPEIDAFLGVVARHAGVRKVEHRFPFSWSVMRAKSDEVAAVARSLDELLSDRYGAMFYFAAEKNYTTARDVVAMIEQTRKTELQPISDEEFAAYLQVATQWIARTLGNEGPSG